jgi:hypothetical protein
MKVKALMLSKGVVKMKAPKAKNKQRVTKQVRALAATLCDLYFAALRRTMQEHTRGSRGGVMAMRLVQEYASLDAVNQRYFRRAADACLQLDADPREYVTAQFRRWSEMSQRTGKVLLPQPSHLVSLGAQARFLQYKLQKTHRHDRLTVPETQQRSFFTDDRRLKGLVRVLRLPEEDILTSRPAEFSKEYLQHRGVWSLVADNWFEQ